MSTAAGGALDSTATVDRTWSCPLVTSDGLRILSVGGAPGFVGIPDGAGMRVADELIPETQSLLSVSNKAILVNRRCKRGVRSRSAGAFRGRPASSPRDTTASGDRRASSCV